MSCTADHLPHHDCQPAPLHPRHSCLNKPVSTAFSRCGLDSLKILLLVRVIDDCIRA
jgi:hypothetical protein